MISVLPSPLQTSDSTAVGCPRLFLRFHRPPFHPSDESMVFFGACAIVFFGARKIDRIRRKESSPPRRHLRRDFIHDTRAVPHVYFLRVRQNRVLCRTGRAYVGTRLEIDRREHRGTNRTSAKERRDMFSRRVDFDDRVRIDVL